MRRWRGLADWHDTLNAKHRVLLMTACGGRLLVAALVHLKPKGVQFECRLIRVNQGGGRRDIRHFGTMIDAA